VPTTWYRCLTPSIVISRGPGPRASEAVIADHQPQGCLTLR
jgi:hypothetical protein